jgi:hypothetical protein
MVRLTSHPPRWAALSVLIAALAILLAPIPAAAAVAADSPAGRAAAWIAREYQAPNSEIALYGTGVLIDSLVSLAATGTESRVARDMLDDLHAVAADYVGTETTFNAGAAGKTLHVLEIYGEDAADFVGSDIEAELRASMQTTGADAGRFGEAQVFEQTEAVLGLAMTEGGVPVAAVAYLASQQCSNGEFTYDGTCPGPGDADTTGIAAVALIAAGEDTASAAAVSWLESIQTQDGSIPGYGTPNTNSTAAAAQAFVAAGETTAAAAAGGYLAAMQFPASADPADAGGLKWLGTDTTANTFATVQGVWGMGVPALFELSAPTFVDTEGSVFASSIEWIADAGITEGCNPPDNDEFCPGAGVTRGEMAAFIKRAFDLPAGSGSGFSDIAGSVFAGDIEAIAAAGVTKGCNPPDNDRYCPDQPVTRGQVAAFLYRAINR